MAPFMAAVAIIAGATNAAYETVCPLASVTSPTMAPNPNPRLSR